MRILVTGTAGFIGFHTAKRLLDRGDTVLGIDNLNDYYDVSLKEARLQQLLDHESVKCSVMGHTERTNDTHASSFTFEKLDIADRDGMKRFFAEHQIDRVIHLAAQAGVRHSITNPYAYVDSNLVGFINILEGCRHHKIQHLVYASSSSVYGSNKQMPFSVHHNVDHPVSLYAATKKANELMAHTYSHLYGLPTTGLRFFTVYGPWGRPDMAYWLFTESVLSGKPIQVFNYGKMQRDFTYVQDVVEGIVRVLERVPPPDPHWDPVQADPGTSTAPYRVYNIGNHSPIELLRFIEVIENCLGRKAIRNLLPLQSGDVTSTCADVADLMRDTDFQPRTPIEVGVARFVEWYLAYLGRPAGLIELDADPHS